MAINDLLGSLPSFIEGFQGLQLMSDGADMALQGAAYNASLYRMAATSSVDMAEYNVKLIQLNSNRQQDAMAKQYMQIRQQNQAAWATSGFSFNSGSYLAVQNKVQNTMERKLLEQRNNIIIEKANTRYQGQVAAVQNENAARAAEYQGQIAAYNAEVQQNKSMSGLFQNALSLFMG